MNADLLTMELHRDEGLKLKLYKDSKGIWSIGVGRNLEAKGVRFDEAILMLKNDIDDVLTDLDTHLPWWRQLDEVRQRVLANMCFNLGIERLLCFHNMLAALQAGNFDEAANEMVASNWDHEVGDRAVRLVAAMRSGKMEEPQ